MRSWSSFVLCETGVSRFTSVVDGTRARVVEPRLYYREVAALRGGDDVPWYDHCEFGNAVAITCRRGARVTKPLLSQALDPGID